jgi:hypothetical protein
MVTPLLFRILDASNRLCILSDAFLIKVFPFYSVVFTRSCCGWPLLGVVLTGARDCMLPSYNVRLPCDACISRESSGCFQGSFFVELVFWAGCSKSSCFQVVIILYYSLLNLRFIIIPIGITI